MTTISRSEICSRCHKDSANCTCDNFHPNISVYEFTIDEVKALFRIFERQYLPYDDTEIHDVTKKIMNIIKAHGQ